MMERQRGRIVWFNPRKGYGFIRRNKGRDVYVEAEQVLSGDRSLREGEEVEFGVRLLPRGPAAVDVIRL